MITIDFETMGIEGRPAYPPVAAGVSIKYKGRKAKYYAWGHPEGNNCSWGQAAEALRAAWDSNEPLLFFNAKFDVDICETEFELPRLPWGRIHDAMFLVFLDDPHQMQLGLKPSSERVLGLPPDEQDAVSDWLVENQPIHDVKISAKAGSKNSFGKYIVFAPGDLVGEYANGDVERTEQLFNKLFTRIVDQGMEEAYNRERKLMLVLLDMERQGLPVDLFRLRSDVAMYEELRAKIEGWVLKRLGTKELNINSGDQLVEALIASKKINLEKLGVTESGKWETTKEALNSAMTDKVLNAVLKYRTQLSTCLDTFMKPWLATAEKSGGLIYTNWNQIRSSYGAGTAGTRTGRLSSTPNFQNIPKEFEAIFAHEKKGLPKAPFSTPSLPKVRGYITPFKGELFVDRDWSQQEPRILAHFEGGDLMAKYNEEPWIDFHTNAQKELAAIGKVYDRRPVKNTNLGLIYGMGVASLAERNGMAVNESKALKAAIMAMYPGLNQMYKEMKRRARAGEPIRTWGGRVYYCEPPKIVAGRTRTFDYKMVNVLVQGSAADCTKEALIRLAETKKPEWRIVLNVHDQITASVPVKDKKVAMEVLRAAMEDIEFDVPMLSEGSVSTTNWNELSDYDVKGVLV